MALLFSKQIASNRCLTVVNVLLYRPPFKAQLAYQKAGVVCNRRPWCSWILMHPNGALPIQSSPHPAQPSSPDHECATLGTV